MDKCVSNMFLYSILVQKHTRGECERYGLTQPHVGTGQHMFLLNNTVWLAG